MDYLVHEGYSRTAAKFAKEANIQPPPEQESIQPRVEIRNAIYSGDIETAIHQINDLNPQVSAFYH
jgi:glucose-induced degradation protein 8